MMGNKISYIIPLFGIGGNLWRYLANCGVFSPISAVLNKLENLF